MPPENELTPEARQAFERGASAEEGYFSVAERTAGSLGLTDPAEPVATVVVHPDDDPAEPGSRRYILTDDTEWSVEADDARPWDLLTGNQHPENDREAHLSLSHAHVAGWRRQPLTALANILGHV